MNAVALQIENDHEIIDACLEGNASQGATALVRKYQHFVMMTAVRILGDYEEAEDCTQEVFIKALGAINRFRRESSLKTWLYRITYNTCANVLRKRKLFFWRKQSLNESYENILQDNVFADDNLKKSELEQQFLRALSRLPKKQREVFALRYFDDLSYNEIAEMLGTSVGGLKANYYHAVHKLGNELKEFVL